MAAVNLYPDDAPRREVVWHEAPDRAVLARRVADALESAAREAVQSLREMMAGRAEHPVPLSEERVRKAIEEYEAFAGGGAPPR